MKQIHFGGILVVLGSSFLTLIALPPIWSRLGAIAHGFAWSLPVLFFGIIIYGIFLALRGYRERAVASPSPASESTLPTAILAEDVDRFNMDHNRLESEGHGLHLKNVRHADVSRNYISAAGSALIIGNAPPPTSQPAKIAEDET